MTIEIALFDNDETKRIETFQVEPGREQERFNTVYEFVKHSMKLADLDGVVAPDCFVGDVCGSKR